MRLLIISALCLLAVPARAYDLHLSPQDMLLIGEALDAMPHGKVAALYQRIQQQLSAEDAAAATAARAKIEAEVSNKIAAEQKAKTPPPAPSPPPASPPVLKDSPYE